MKNLIFGILFISISAYGQEFNFDIHNTSLSKYIQMEENMESERISATSNYISFTDDAQPIEFLRKEKVIPDLKVYYFFKKVDSTMSYILYEWDVYNFEKQDNNQKSKKFQEALIEKYKKLKNKIAENFGQPKTKNNYSNIGLLGFDDIFEENSIWKPNDNIEIELYITVSNYYEKKGIITINPVHRIRLYVRDKSEKAETITPILEEKKD